MNERAWGFRYRLSSMAVLAYGMVACGAGRDDSAKEQLGEQLQELTPAQVPLLPVLEPHPLSPAGCADGSVEQVFAGGIVGCAGAVTFPNRKSLCAVGYHPLAAMTWRTSRGTVAPTHHYWTNDILNYTGTGTGMCSAAQREERQRYGADHAADRE